MDAAPPLADRSPPPPPAAEFRGKARTFVRAVEAEDVRLMALVDHLAGKLRGAGVPGFRQPNVRAIWQQWQREAPRRFLIDRNHRTGKGRLELYEVRVAASRYEDSERWTGWEPGVSIELARLDSHRRVFFANRTLAFVSLHALARWHARSWACDEAALLRDLAPLGSVQLADDTGATAVECEGGVWRGSVEAVRNDHGGAERTFLARTFTEG